MKVFIYSHTHWDREWYLSQNQFQYRLIRTLDEIIEMLQADNGFDVFVLDGQTCIVEDYLEIKPERRGVITDLIRKGQLIIGPWFTMPDTFLPDGESLIRNLLRGYQDCQDYGAPYPNVGYVPDSFGHIEQMPQILRGVGIDNYVFSRGRPVCLDSAQGHKREFLWQSPDGSEVFAWHLPGGYTAGCFLPGPQELEALKQRIEEAVRHFAGSHRPDIALLPHGIDHTWLQRDIPEILKALPGLMPDIEFHHGSLEDALREWKKAIPGMETYRGPLRGRLHMHELHGTLSSRIDNKILNEMAQMHIENLAEPLDAMSSWFGRSPARPFLRKAWRRIFQNHAHDSICGCSRDAIHEEVNRRFLEAIELGTDVADGALDYLNNDARKANAPTLIVYAGLNGGHSVIDFLLRRKEDLDKPVHFEDEEGESYPVQIDRSERLRMLTTAEEVRYTESRGCVWIPNLKPAEVRRLSLKEGKARDPRPRIRCSGRSMDNGILKVTVNEDGTLALMDHRTGRTVEKTHVFVHEPDLGGGYHFEPLSEDSARTSPHGRARVRVLSRGPFRLQMEVFLRLDVPQRYDRSQKALTGKASIPIRCLLSLERGSDVLHVVTHIENTATNHRIRLALPTGMKSPKTHVETSFSVSSLDPGQWPSEPGQASHPMRNFASFSEAGSGMTFMGKGLHEMATRVTPEGVQLEVTFLRSVDFVFVCGTWKTPEAQLEKTLRYEYALRLHPGNWEEALVPKSVAAFRNPAIAEIHGDEVLSAPERPLATVGFYAQEKESEIPVDMARSSWKVVPSHRDGWRRVEKDRFVTESLSRRILPFEVEGETVVVSAFKRAEDGRGDILRLSNCSASSQEVKVRGGTPQVSLQRVDLLERETKPALKEIGELAIVMKPFEIATFRLCG